MRAQGSGTGGIGAMPPETEARSAPRRPRLSHPGPAIAALALGGFAIGTTEFVTMGLLPDIAEGIGTSLPRAGHIITAYALGVVVGAPVIVTLAARLPWRGLVIGLALALGAGSAASALADSYPAMMAARFASGLPHGAYFGVASLIAASLVRPERSGRAVSGVMIGLSAATVAGVPASTWLGQELGWRSAYWLVLALALAGALGVAVFVPPRPGNSSASARGELGALRRPAVWFALGAGMVGFGGIFAMYSYIAPLVTEVADVSAGLIAWYLLAFGIGSVGGTWLAGRLADWDVARSVLAGFGVAVVVLAAIAVFAGSAPALWVLVALVGVLGSVLAITLQLRLMEAAGEARMLGAALNHASLNVANGLGAWLGSIVIASGWGFRAPSAVGAGLAGLGLVVFAVGLARTRAHRAG